MFWWSFSQKLRSNLGRGANFFSRCENAPYFYVTPRRLRLLDNVTSSISLMPFHPKLSLDMLKRREGDHPRSLLLFVRIVGLIKELVILLPSSPVLNNPDDGHNSYYTYDLESREETTSTINFLVCIHKTCKISFLPQDYFHIWDNSSYLGVALEYPWRVLD